MARTRKQKEELVKEYAERIRASKALYFVEPNGLTANQTSELKMKLYDHEANINVVKNSLFKRALDEVGYKVDANVEQLPKAVIFVKENVSEAAKVIKEFTSDKENTEKLSIVGGILDEGEISVSQIKEIADLPSKEVMIAKVIGTMQAPISGFVNVLGGNLRNILNVLNAIKDSNQNNNLFIFIF